MTKEQIEIYEYGKKYLLKLEDYKKNLPFKSQEFGCGSGRPSIEFQLENIHKIMYEAVFNAMHSAGESVNKIIEEL